jgi:EAL domain-containing protein (putative c-di-GMP-specific phosphodiesterase class I)
MIAFAPDLVTLDRYFLSPGAHAPCTIDAIAHLVGFAREMGADVIVDGVDNCELAGVAQKLGGTFFKGDWCGRPRLFRSWANPACREELPWSVPQRRQGVAVVNQDFQGS